MIIKGISHEGIIVKNLERTIAFYVDVLGLELVSGPSKPFTDPSEGVGMGIEGDNRTHKHREAILRVPGGDTLELIEFSDPSPILIPPTAACIGKIHLGFLVDDIRAWTKKLKSYGVVPFSEPNEFETPDAESGKGYWMYMRDPDGIIFEMQQI